MRRQRRLKPLNVVRPRPEHVARLAFDQPLRLLLDAVETEGHAKGCQWSVKVDSPYLEIKSTRSFSSRKGDYLEVVIEQKKTLLRWRALSQFFLGNVRVYVEQRLEGIPEDADPVVDHHSTLFVFLDCKEPTRQNIVTVVEPEPGHNYIRPQVVLEPDQVLEVVLADVPGKPLTWRPYSFPFDSAEMLLEPIHFEYLAVGEGVGTFPTPAHPYYCERRVLPAGDGACPTFGEWHIFLKFQHPPTSYLEQVTDICTPATRLVFIGKVTEENRFAKDRRLDVLMRVKESVRKRLAKQEKAGSATEPITALQQYGCILQRMVDEDQRVIINPSRTEQITLRGSRDEFVVQIVQPSLYYLGSDGLQNVRWAASLESAHVRAKNIKHLRFEPLPDKSVNEIQFQRWKVWLDSVDHDQREVVLGKFILTCPERQAQENDETKDIVLYLIYRHSAGKLVSSARQVTCGDSTYSVLSSKDSTGQTAFASAWNGTGNRQRDSYVSPYYNHKGTAGTAGKKQKNKQKHWLEYWEVDVADSGNDLVAGEQIEYMKLGGATGNLPIVYNNGRLPYISPELSNLIDAEMGVGGGERDSKKKRNPNTNERLLDGSASDKSGLNGNGNKMNLLGNWSKNEQASGESDEGEESGSRNTLTFGANNPKHIYWPRPEQTIGVERAQPIVIHVLLPKGEFKSKQLRKQWTVNVVNILSKEGFQLWVATNKIVEGTSVVHQEITVLPLTPRNAEPGEYRIGAIRLQCDDEVRNFNVDLRIGSGDAREQLRWHLNYYRSLRAARPIDTGRPFNVITSRVHNRTTLFDPIGKTIDVPVHDTHDIEILLTDPHKYSAKNGWNIWPRVIGGGSIRILDNSLYHLWDGEPIHRFLLRVDRNDQTFFAEIKITYDGEDVKTRICPYSARPTDQIVDDVGEEPIRNRGYVRLCNDSNSLRVRVADWSNGQHVAVFPNEWLHINVPARTDYLDAPFKHACAHSRWKVEIVDNPIDDAVWALLPTETKKRLDQECSFYSNHGLFSSNVAPWEAEEYVLPPLEESQPHIYDILNAMKRYYGPARGYPVVEVKFSCEVDGRFEISQTLCIDVAPDFAVSDVELESALALDNPADHSKYTVEDRQPLVIHLPYRWSNSTHRREVNRIHWECTEMPTWLMRIDMQDDPKHNRETFTFLTALGAMHSADQGVVDGVLEFVCGEEVYKKRIWMQAISMTDLALQPS